MSGVHCKPTVGGDFRAGTSIDQIFASHFGRETQLASLELTTESPEFGGTCDTGFACVYTNTLSWRGPMTPLPMQDNPRLVFERMFGDGGSTDPGVRRARLQSRASVLDSVLDKTASLNARIGNGDAVRIVRGSLNSYRMFPERGGLLRVRRLPCGQTRNDDIVEKCRAATAAVKQNLSARP